MWHSSAAARPLPQPPLPWYHALGGESRAASAVRRLALLLSGEEMASNRSHVRPLSHLT